MKSTAFSITIYLKTQVIKLEKRHTREAGRPTLGQGFRARVLHWVLCNTFVLTAMKGFSVLNETAACTEAVFMS